MINIEALTMLEMAKRDIIPAVSDFVAEMCSNLATKQAVFEGIPLEPEKSIISKLANLNEKADKAVAKLQEDLKNVNIEDIKSASQTMAHVIVPDMEEVRGLVDEMETLTSSDYWPYPTYYDLLYSVK